MIKRIFSLIHDVFSLCYIILRLITQGILLDYLRLQFSNEQQKIQSKEKLAKKIVSIAPSLGPAFIKAIQFLSTRPDLISGSMRNIFSQIHDTVPAVPFEQINKVIVSQIGSHIFKTIEKKPIATASIAQVYKAITIKDEIVAVKVLRPNIKKQFRKNLSLLKHILITLNFFFDLKRLKLREVLHDIKRVSLLEMNFRIEAAAADKLRSNLANDVDVYVPFVLWHYTTEQILVTEWVEGINLNNLTQTNNYGLDVKKISKTLAISFFNQLYRDGFFHADLHHGNILITTKGIVVFIDFGIMGHLDHFHRMTMMKILQSFMNRDYDEVAHLHSVAGYIPQSTSVEDFALACRSIGEQALNKPSHEVSIGLLLQQLLEIAQSFDMQVQPQLILMQKTILTLEGIGMTLHNSNNIWLMGKQWLEQRQSKIFQMKADALYKYYYLRKTFNELNGTLGNIVNFFKDASEHSTGNHKK